MSTSYRFIGTTDDVLTCGHCGRTDLTHTLILSVLDSEGNAEDVIHLGSTCAVNYLRGRGVRTTAARVNREARAADAAAVRARMEADHAEQMARRDEVLRSRGIDPATATPRECLAALHEVWFTTSR